MTISFPRKWIKVSEKMANFGTLNSWFGVRGERKLRASTHGITKLVTLSLFSNFRLKQTSTTLAQLNKQQNRKYNNQTRTTAGVHLFACLEVVLYAMRCTFNCHTISNFDTKLWCAPANIFDTIEKLVDDENSLSRRGNFAHLQNTEHREFSVGAIWIRFWQMRFRVY